MGNLISTTAFAAIAVLSISPYVQAQSAIPPASASQSTPEWQTAAGTKMEFEAASIKPSPLGAKPHANFSINIDNDTMPPGGLISTSDMSLPVYIQFAYKLMLTQEQVAAMVAHLPKWVGEQGFDIEARAEDNPIKDQLRLMMQSLLADRFKLAIHFETVNAHVLAMVLDKPGKLGPRLRPHAQGLPCDAKWIAPPGRAALSVAPGGFLPSCGAFQALSGAGHTILFGARNVTQSRPTSGSFRR